MFFPVEKLKNSKIQGPVIVGYPDCRTCSFINTLCSDDKHEHCRLAHEALKNIRKDSFYELNDDEWEEVYSAMSCCWMCGNLLQCLEEYVDSWHGPRDDVVRELFQVEDYETLITLVKRMRKRLDTGDM